MEEKKHTTIVDRWSFDELVKMYIEALKREVTAQASGYKYGL